LNKCFFLEDLFITTGASTPAQLCVAVLHRRFFKKLWTSVVRNCAETRTMPSNPP